jgi:serine/threonine protein kinase
MDLSTSSKSHGLLSSSDSIALEVDADGSFVSEAKDEFVCEPHYARDAKLGVGSYGTVWSAKALSGACGLEEGTGVAIKRISGLYKNSMLFAKRLLREVCMLRRLQHDNVISILDCYRHGRSVYLVTQLMDADLDQVIKSDQQLLPAHVSYFVQHILLGLQYLHSCGCLHRDLKPANVLVNEDCHIRIADLGMARLINDTKGSQGPAMTEYVVSRWWRAPEVMISDSYDYAIDVWSVGTIMAELMLRKPLFQGRDYADQLVRIIKVVGSPDEASIAAIPDPNARGFVAGLKKCERVPWTTLFPNASDEQIASLDAMLQFDPKRRATVSQLLTMKGLKPKQKKDTAAEKEAVKPIKFEWEEESLKSVDDVEFWLDRELHEAQMLREERIANLKK